VLPRFLTGLPTRFEVGSGAVIFNALQIDIDTSSGATLALQRISRLLDA
jgi:calcineurin-like phosphoesterase